MRHLLCTLPIAGLVLCLAAGVSADQPGEPKYSQLGELDIKTAKVGTTGALLREKSEWSKTANGALGMSATIFTYRIQQILSDKEALVRRDALDMGTALPRSGQLRKDDGRFVVEMDTKGRIDEELIELKGTFEVVKTAKVGTATHFYLRPASPKK